MTSEESGHWLSEAEMAAWLPLINVAMRLPARLDSQLRTDSALTHYEYLVLAKLSEEPEQRMGLSALAEACNSSPSRLSHVLRKLSERSLLTRHATGRSAHAELSPEGLAALQVAARGHVREVRRRVFDHLTADDVAAIAQVLPKLTAGLAGYV